MTTTRKNSGEDIERRMRIIDGSICAVINLFRIFMISRFIQIFVEREEENKNKYIIAYGSFFVINTGLYLCFHLAWVNILCNILGICLILMLYTKSLKVNLFITFSIYMINMSCDMVAILLFVKYEDGVSFRQIYSVITVLLIFICERITRKIVIGKRGSENIQHMALILVPLCSVAMICLLIYTDSCTAIGLIIVCLGLLLANFMIYWLYNFTLDGITQKYENQALHQKINSYANQIELMLLGENKIKAIRHDMKHHMNELKLLALQGENDKMITYIDDMEQFISNSNEIISSGNIEIDSLLNYMLHKAKEELNDVNVVLKIPEAIMHTFDINVILGNLLENAIDAAKVTKEKILNVDIQLKKGVLKIKIENSFEGDLEKKEQKLVTTKKNKEEHGIGLNNVERIVQKYNGMMEVYTQDNRFGIRLVLYMLKLEEKK